MARRDGTPGRPAPRARKLTLFLLPLAQLELQAVETTHETRAHLEMRLIHGSYPEVVLMDSNEDREIYLKELITTRKSTVRDGGRTGPDLHVGKRLRRC